MPIADSRSGHRNCYVPATTLPARTTIPDLHAAAAAVAEFSKCLAEDPDAAKRRLLEIAQDLCEAGSAGLSLVRQSLTGDEVMRWEVVSGALAHHETTDARRPSSPCGLCLDIGIAILISRPHVVFDGLADKLPAIAEVLTIPLYDGAGQPLGTLWVAHHDSKAHFDSEDVRIVEQLAAQLVLALKLQEQLSEHAHTLAVFESYQHAERNLLVHELYNERAMREQAEIDHRQALRFKDALIVETNHRANNTLQAASNLLTLQARASSSSEVREALLDNATPLHLLAKAHELLYANPDSMQAVLMPQLLQALGDTLRQSFGIAHPQVRLQIACDPMELPTQDAMAVALLTNEAITNAYKHAFPGERAGVITVELLGTRETLRLRIEDTGAGFAPADGAEGMGMTLIRTFAAQLCGTLDVTCRGDGMGTSVTLTIAARSQ